MSKSRGNIVRTETILDVLGADALRYFLLREVVFGQDGSFSFRRAGAALQLRPGEWSRQSGQPHADHDQPLFQRRGPVSVAGGVENRGGCCNRRDGREDHRANSATLFDQFQFSRALEVAWGLVAAVDKYIVENEPWALGEKQDEESRARLATVLYTSAEALRIVTALAYPVMPDATAKIWAQMGLGDIKKCALSELQWGQLPLGTKLGEVKPVFPRADKSAVERMQQDGRAARGQPVADGRSVTAHRRQPGDAQLPPPRNVRSAAAAPATAKLPSTTSPRSNCAWRK